MEFDLTEPQERIKKVAREFALKEFPGRARECDLNEEFPRDVWKKECEQGFVTVYIPQEYNGAGLGYLEQCLIVEEQSRIDPGLGMIPVGAGLGAEVVMCNGTEEQKKNYLSKIPTGENISCIAITEPGAGSDVAGIETRAEKEGDEYVLNGTKMFITNGNIADWSIVLAITDPQEPNRHRRFSTFVVDTSSDGFEAKKIEGKMGMRATDTAEILLNDVRVPEGNLVGGRGRGFYNIMEFFNRSRIYIGAQGLGIAGGALDLAMSYTREREAFGKPLVENQGLQFELAEMKLRVEASRNLVYKAAWKMDNNIDNIVDVAIAKWYAGESAVRCCDLSLQMHGGYGYIDDMDIERFYRAAKVIEIYEGAKHIEKSIVARRLLAL
jgi:alkylation response protein AidB-like acyl-CoA dehydrogenase